MAASPAWAAPRRADARADGRGATPHDPLSDDFEAPVLRATWGAWKETDMSRYAVGGGALTARAKGASYAESSPLTIMARDESYAVQVVVSVEEKGCAALGLEYNPQTAAFVELRSGGLNVESPKGRLANRDWSKDRAWLRIVNRRNRVEFLASEDGKRWQSLAEFDASGFDHNGQRAGFRPRAPRSRPTTAATPVSWTFATVRRRARRTSPDPCVDPTGRWTTMKITAYSTALYSTWIFIEELRLLFDAGRRRGGGVGREGKEGKDGRPLALRSRPRHGPPPTSATFTPATTVCACSTPPTAGASPARRLLPPLRPLGGAVRELGAGRARRARWLGRRPCPRAGPEHARSGQGHPVVGLPGGEAGQEVESGVRRDAGSGTGGDGSGRDDGGDRAAHPRLFRRHRADGARDMGGPARLDHEATFLRQSDVERGPERTQLHSCLDEVLDLARTAAPERLVLTHLSPRYHETEACEAIAQAAREMGLEFPIWLVPPDASCPTCRRGGGLGWHKVRGMEVTVRFDGRAFVPKEDAAFPEEPRERLRSLTRMVSTSGCDGSRRGGRCPTSIWSILIGTTSIRERQPT